MYVNVAFRILIARPDNTTDCHMTSASANDTPDVASDYVSRRNSLENALSHMRVAGARDSPMMTVQLTPGVEISTYYFHICSFNYDIRHMTFTYILS